MTRRCFLFLAVVLSTAVDTFPQDVKEDAIYIIFDASGSMWGQLADKTHKIEAARRVLTEFVAGDFGGRNLALRVYGHRREGDCSDSELVVPFSQPQAVSGEIKGFVDEINPKGRTPISRSLRAALEDFGDRSGDIILISDGIETCDEDPCELVRAWREKDIDIRVHVVGLGLNQEERQAMSCISEAAGTDFHGAGSATELAASLDSIRTTSSSNALFIRGLTLDGRSVAVEGLARSADSEPVRVSSNARNLLAPGKYTLQLGVRTRNGNLYQPVEHEVRVADRGETAVEIEVPEPPSIKARFLEAGEETAGALITAFENGKEAFKFRWMDQVYVDPGSYEFRSKPNRENDLTVAESLAAGDHKEIVFELVDTVTAVIKMVAQGSGIDFRRNYELWQEGARKYKVHWSNGIRALPGVYDLHLPDPLNPYVHRDLELSSEERQDFRIEISVGHVTVIYQNADGSRNRDERYWIMRLENGKSVARDLKRTGRSIPLLPGSYRLEGWNRMGEFDLLDFEVVEGAEQELVLRSKK